MTDQHAPGFSGCDKCDTGPHGWTIWALTTGSRRPHRRRAWASFPRDFIFSDRLTLEFILSFPITHFPDCFTHILHTLLKFLRHLVAASSRAAVLLVAVSSAPNPSGKIPGA